MRCILNLTQDINASLFCAYNIKMNRSRSRKGKNSQLPLFITKLVEMVQNTQIQDIISWTTTADSFNIKNISKFTDQVLPRYFKHRNLSSFIRQLNMYGFRKMRHSDGQNVYMHQYFKPGNRNQFKHINRKMREEKEERIVLYQSGASKSDGANSKEIQELKSKQKNLEQMCRNFFIQNQKLAEENQNLIKKMENETRERQKRLEDLLFQLTQRRIQNQLTGQQQLSIAEQPFHSPSGSQSSSSNDGHLRRVQSLLEQLYDFRNGGINEPKHEQPAHQVNKIGIGLGIDEEQNSYMSINDFINAEDYQNEINLEESR